MSLTDAIKRRLDGWVNMLTGLGMLSRDKTSNTSFVGQKTFQEPELADMYRCEGLAKRIVNLPVREMTRKGFKITGDPEGMVIAEMKRLKANELIPDLLRWSRVFGGAIAVLWIDDGRELEEELNENDIKSIEAIRVYDRYRVNRNAGIDNDIKSKTYGETLIYEITPISGSPFKVHRSRVIIDDGENIPDRLRNQNKGWGDSVYQAVYEKIRAYGSALKITENIIDDFILTILSIENLQDMIASGEDGENLIKTRLNLMDLSKNVINTILLDSKEQFTKQSSSVAGLSDLIDRFAQAVSSVTGIPITLLLGTSPKGLNATGESDITLWYDNIASTQIDELEPIIRRLSYLIMLAKNGPFKGKPLDKWDIVFNPLWEMSEKEQAELHKTQAEADERYINAGVLRPEEVAISRFGGGKYNIQTDLLNEEERLENFQKENDETNE